MINPCLIDVHAHLQDEKFAEEQEEIVANARNSGVCRIINAATCVSTSLAAIDLAERFSECFATVGIHPHDASSFDDNSLNVFRDLAGKKKVLAIGEIGLDFHYDFSPRDIQEKVLESLWSLACDLNMPVVVHVREAYERFWPIVESMPNPQAVLLHCFSGDLATARKAADKGYHFSIGGALTFPKSDLAREVFAYLPEDLIHLETDCPYLAPQPKRGKRNEPSLLPITFEYLAEIRKSSKASLKERLWQNAIALFGEELS
jgi:TatD DNase family protein